MTTPDKKPFNVIGERLPRYDGADKVTGKAVFGPDVTLPGMLYGFVLRSPHAHARILSIDTSRAETLPGVYAVVTAADLPPAEDTDQRYARDNTLAGDKVLYAGQAVAAVAARTPTIAEAAARLIVVKYEVLPAVTDVLEAMRDDAPILHEEMRTRSPAGRSDKPSNIAEHFRYVKGDPARGFAEADVIVEREFRTVTVHQGYIESHAATATWSDTGTLTIYTTTQGSFAVRDHVAWLLHLPLACVRVVPTEVGGAFGGKNTSYVDVVAALLARKARRPVKVTMPRPDVFMATGPSSGAAFRVKMGATRDGRITAAQAELYYAAGAYPGSPVGSGANVMFGPYAIPNGQIDGYDVVTNGPRVSSYRAPGATPANFAAETVIDELAEKLGLDPIEFRLRNHAKEGDVRLDGGTHGHIGGIETLEAARACAHYNAPLGDPRPGMRRGRGVAHGYWGNWGGRSSCTLTVNGDGTVNLVTSSVDLSGTRTTLAMQAAEALELPPERIKPGVGDTDTTGYADVSAGSRTTYATGIAAIKAAQDIIAQMRRRAAELWDVPVENVTYAQGVFSAGNEFRFTFAELAQLVTRFGGAVSSLVNVDVPQWGAGFSTQIADVEVDPETGKVTLLRYTVVQDVGRAVHPAMVEGQMQGGATQGIGWALYEGYAYNEKGQMLNANFLDYKIPTALDVPLIETVIVEVPYPEHPFGVRGVGEPPIVPPPAAIANAIYRAVGIRPDRLPMTPAHLLEKMGVI
ncbi:MAG TPA: xanthine dehydrogenase family protein molybdopterin-binding subunit [Anaerolineae bacterium]|nr:xanthine dehydrogenase family protein molybdopterin-binding subunit [Anaerolineae bacterium]HQK14357.1 xanthine dehydrogenase family protein molybdopterin-binding subunit [Anaerolineae bacterium]